jgi:hypothetical protein
LLSVALVNAAASAETAPVDLKTAGNYAILAKSGISNMPTSTITGNIGVSPIAASAITGFGLALDSATRQFSTASQITGQAHAADYGGDVEAELTVAVLDMQNAYTDAASRTTTNHAASRTTSDSARDSLLDGSIGGQTLTPGVYTLTAGITISSDITFEGSADDVFIIQTAGILTLTANTRVILSGVAQAKNIFWQVAGHAVIGAGASMQGILLVFTHVVLVTGSSLVGGIFAQTDVNLQMATITQDTQVVVECWVASDCGDTTLFTCKSEHCVPLSCNTEQTGVECCEDSECGDVVSFRCESTSCVLRGCDTSLQEVECCADDDCNSGGSGSIACVSNVCVNQGGPSFTLTWFGNGKVFCILPLDHKTACVYVAHTCFLLYLSNR